MNIRRILAVASLALLPAMTACGGSGKAAAPPDPVATTSTPAKPAGTRLGHYENIVLSRGGSIDFDDDPFTKRVADGDLQYYRDIEAHRIAALPSGVRGGYRTCRDRTGDDRDLTFDQVIRGRAICVITESGLVGHVKVRELKVGQPDDRGILRFDLTVWQGTP